MKRPPRTVVLAAALISGVAVAALILCTALFLRSYRSAVVEGARTNSSHAGFFFKNCRPNTWFNQGGFLSRIIDSG